MNAKGLHDCLKSALFYVGVTDACYKPKLIGFGCDGASVNIGENALKGLLQSERPWILTDWCLSHRLELALKDALKNTPFSLINEVLLRLYYLYSKAPKKEM